MALQPIAQTRGWPAGQALPFSYNYNKKNHTANYHRLTNDVFYTNVSLFYHLITRVYWLYAVYL